MKFGCPLCSFKSFKESSLEQHLWMKHGDEGYDFLMANFISNGLPLPPTLQCYCDSQNQSALVKSITNGAVKENKEDTPRNMARESFVLHVQQANKEETMTEIIQNIEESYTNTSYNLKLKRLHSIKAPETGLLSSNIEVNPVLLRGISNHRFNFDNVQNSCDINTYNFSNVDKCYIWNGYNSPQTVCEIPACVNMYKTVDSSDYVTIFSQKEVEHLELYTGRNNFPFLTLNCSQQHVENVDPEIQDSKSACFLVDITGDKEVLRKGVQMGLNSLQLLHDGTLFRGHIVPLSSSTCMRQLHTILCIDSIRNLVVWNNPD